MIIMYMMIERERGRETTPPKATQHNKFTSEQSKQQQHNTHTHKFTLTHSQPPQNLPCHLTSCLPSYLPTQSPRPWPHCHLF